MTLHRRPVLRLSVALLAIAGTFALTVAVRGDGETPGLAALPAQTKAPNADQVALGRLLFFDGRLSGDATISCASCHNPEKGWSDGRSMSIGYPGAQYFRNTPTVVNSAHGRFAYWDGRLPLSDMPTLVRDHISEAHFMQADGRLVIERMRQVPEYEAAFEKAFGGEPTYGKILKAVSAYVISLRSVDVPLDKFLGGDEKALSDSAKRGMELFKGKAGCIGCHNGPMLSDGGFHDLGLPASREIFTNAERHVTYRRFMKTLGVPRYRQVRKDVGRYAVTKQRKDIARFRTPTLREVSRTAPYMHDGSLATLTDVVEFYDAGGGKRAGKSKRLKPLGLTKEEVADLVAFLEALSGKPITEKRPALPQYKARRLGGK